MNAFCALQNGQAMDLSAVPQLSLTDFRQAILDGVRAGQRLACLCIAEERQLFALLADPGKHHFLLGSTCLESDSFPSLTPECPSAQLFEREIAEQSSVRPIGHPWFKPVRHHLAWNGKPDLWDRPIPLEPGVIDFFQIEGQELHEVAVGPVHAGVIEPGHFRFLCHGETVHHLEITLGYQHRGIEQALRGGPHPLSLKMAETMAGDTSIGHAWAHCLLREGLSGQICSPRAQLLRALALELERLANHVGDLGALSGDVGFLPTASFCGRIRGEWLGLTARICGSRLGRDWLIPGGVRFDLPPEKVASFRQQLRRAFLESKDAIELLWGAASVMIRFEAAGALSAETAREVGLVGVAARACGLPIDSRADFPIGIYSDLKVAAQTATSGNVHARAWVRWLEIQASVRLIESLLDRLEAHLSHPPQVQEKAKTALAASQLCAAMVEGWRGELLHLALTDSQGKFQRYKVVDPSFHNWFGLALALRGQQISDFPLCNKSFNLSYCGHDL